MVQTTELEKFLHKSSPLLDVRSPEEFAKGHIPGSQSFALFNNKEREMIGIAYKKQSRQEAITLGLLLVESNFNDLLARVSSLLTFEGKILCWRGGMRSGFAGRLLELLGYSIITLRGGYKAYRCWILQKLNHLSFPFLHVLGGLTGSGKTAILQALKNMGEQIIDLESLANHRGGAFGGIGLNLQPTQEQFENEIVMTIEQLDWSKPIWIEDESRLIGSCHLPSLLYQNMIQAPLFYIQRSITERLATLLFQYGWIPKQQLLNAVSRIAKRLGSQLTKEIQQLIEQEQKEQAFEKLLIYYDKTYRHQISKRQIKYCFEGKTDLSPNEWAYLLTKNYKK